MRHGWKLYLFLVVMLVLNACAVLNREDRLRVVESPEGHKIGVNITTATRRLAIVYPGGRTCSELGPPAVMQGKKALSAEGEAAQTGVNLGAELSEDLAAVELQTTTERIECLRIALFHACNAAAIAKLTPEQEEKLLSSAITNCGTWSPPPVETTNSQSP